MRIIRYAKNLMKFILKGGIKRGGITYANISQVNYGKILDKKTILVTGGNSGIGYEIAKKCISEGANVIITGRDKIKLEKASQKLGKENCKYIEFDMNSFDKYDDIINKIFKICDGHLDCLVNNAGTYILRDYHNCKEEEYDSIFNTNMKSIYFFTQKILNKFDTVNNILMISSETSLVGNDGPYGLSKSTLNNYTKGLAKKLADTNRKIRVNALLPGSTISNISTYSKSFDKKDNIYDEGVAGKRVLLPEEIAEVACFMLSEASSCINGQTIACNDGNL